ncbi:DUF305 domain-containing protein [Nocardioides sp. AX2bis]|uniref:DUF305 domain-containing protein n=1 Tax=Nocardioides sp. AX2bis TaxID=2653157 RepID=UPI0012F3EAB1|nr:DUF305 domain-containing protein [Nocardioides sp. AX2bis]VXB09587.1 conserved exported hypothetical protein [Nocardioides sp. AX2bis]
MTTHPRTPARPRTTRRPRRVRTAAAAALLVLTAPVLAACGAGEDHNEADVAFATEMIPHHAQAVEMAAMVDGKDVSPEVADLAAEIAAAQDPEIETMSGWLEEWGEPVPDSDQAMSGDMAGMTGMMSADQMASLEAAEGAAFETSWLELMREHHRGAVEMARAEQADGQDPEAVALAEEIEATQTAEVAVIEDLLAG